MIGKGYHIKPGMGSGSQNVRNTALPVTGTGSMDVKIGR